MTEYDDADRGVDPSAPQWPSRLAPRGDWASLDDLGLQPPPGPGAPNGGPGAPGPAPVIPGPLRVPQAPTPQPAPAPAPPVVAPAAPPAGPPSSPFGSQLNAWGSAAQQTEATVSRPPVVATPDDLLSAVRPDGGAPAAPAPDEWATAATDVRSPGLDDAGMAGATAVAPTVAADPWNGGGPAAGVEAGSATADPWSGQQPGNGFGPTASDADPAPRWASRASQAADAFDPRAASAEAASPFAPAAVPLTSERAGPYGAEAGAATAALPASPFASPPGEVAGGAGLRAPGGPDAPSPFAPEAHRPDPWAARPPAPGTPGAWPVQVPAPGSADSPWAAQMPEPGAADGPWGGQARRPGAPEAQGVPGVPGAWPDQAARLDGPGGRPAPPAPEPTMAYGASPTPAPADAYASSRHPAPSDAYRGPDAYSGPGGYGTGRNPAPGYPAGGAPPPPGYGNGAAHAARPAPPPSAGAQRFRPGAGLAIGLLGLVALVLSFTALPWATSGGEEASFQDIRDAVTSDAYLAPAGPEAVGAAPGESAAAQQAPATSTTLPTFNTVSPTLPDGSPMTPSTAVDPSVGTTAPELDSGGDGSSEFKRDYIDAFASYGWIAVIVWAALATIFTALFVPAGYGGRIATGFLVLGVLGALINLADRRGSVGPRLTGAIATLAGAAAFGVGVSILFDGDFAPSIGYGVWVGAAGLGLVLLACLIGTRRTPAAA